jgi:hypothetical protein
VNRFRTIATAAIAGLVLMACAPASPEPTGSEPGQASQAESQAPQESQGGHEPSFSEGIAGDLEALIPDTVGTLVIQKTSMRGNEYLINPDSDPETVQILEALGVSPADISMAFGFGFDAESGSLVMLVIRAEGANADALAAAFKEAGTEPGVSPMEWIQTTVAGKQVESAEGDGGTTYLYATGDMVIFLTASDSAVAEQIIGDLP